MEMINEKTKTEMMEHLHNHITYPATKKAIVESCNMMSHVPEDGRKMIETKLKDKTYMSADEVMADLGMSM
jgi:hypothetical protein